METTNQKNTQLTKEEVFQGVGEAKSVFDILGGFCMVGFIVFMLSVLLSNLPKNIWYAGLLGVLGYIIIALPCILTFVFKVGLFVNVGPMFYESQTRIGNIIYIRQQRDVNSQMAANIGFTLIKCIIIGLISIILTPIITFISYVNYKKKYKKAVEYAKSNDIEFSKLPTINMKVVYAGIIIIAALFVGSIIADRVSEKYYENRSEEKDSETKEILANVLDNVSYTYGANIANEQEVAVAKVAEFELDGAKVYYGEISTGYSLTYKGLETCSRYYIVDKDGSVNVYIDTYGTENWEKYSPDDIKETYEYLMGRHLSTCIGKDAKCKDSYTMIDDNKTFNYEYNSKAYGIYVNNDNKIERIVNSEHEFDYYLMPDFSADLSTYKDEVSKIIQN